MLYLPSALFTRKLKLPNSHVFNRYLTNKLMDRGSNTRFVTERPFPTSIGAKPPPPSTAHHPLFTPLPPPSLYHICTKTAGRTFSLEVDVDSRESAYAASFTIRSRLPPFRNR